MNNIIGLQDMFLPDYISSARHWELQFLYINRKINELSIKIARGRGGSRKHVSGRPLHRHSAKVWYNLIGPTHLSRHAPLGICTCVYLYICIFLSPHHWPLLTASCPSGISITPFLTYTIDVYCACLYSSCLIAPLSITHFQCTVKCGVKRCP